MTSPQVTVSPAHRFGRPAMKGVSTEMIADLYWAHGESEVEDDYDLSRHELLVVLWFEGSQGMPRFRKRWGAWVRQVEGTLWKVTELDPDLVVLPPTRADLEG